MAELIYVSPTDSRGKSESSEEICKYTVTTKAMGRIKNFSCENGQPMESYERQCKLTQFLCN